MPRTILLTGATGVLGSALAAELAREPSTRLRLLVRARDAAELDRKQRALERFWRSIGERHADAARFDWLTGDVAEPRLGLPESRWRDLAGDLTHIVHSAANVRLDLPIAAARAEAVRGLTEILALREAARCKLDYVSTVGVLGKMGGALREEPLTAAARDFHNTYEAAKAAAEGLLYPLLASGAPVTIHRPSMIVGHSRSGAIIHFQVFHFILRLLSGELTGGLCPDVLRFRLDTVPSDWVARVIAWSCDAAASRGRILHECTGPDDSVSLGDLHELVLQRFRAHDLPARRLIGVPTPVFRRLVEAAGRLSRDPRTRERLGMFPIFLSYLTQRQAFANDGTRALLGPLGDGPPRPESYLPASVDAYARAVAERRAAGRGAAVPRGGAPRRSARRPERAFGVLAMAARETFLPGGIPRRPEANLVMDEASSVAAWLGQGADEGALVPIYHLVSGASSRLAPVGSTVVDLACGSGGFAAYLARRRPDLRVVGFDLSAPMLEAGREALREAGLGDRVELRGGDMTAFARELPPETALVTCSLALHHLPGMREVELCLRELREARARTGCGFLLFDMVRPRHARTAADYPRLLTPDAPAAFSADASSSLVAAYGHDELSGAIERVFGRGAVESELSHGLPLFQAFWRAGTTHRGGRRAPASSGARATSRLSAAARGRYLMLRAMLPRLPS